MRSILQRPFFTVIALIGVMLLSAACAGPWMHGGNHRGRGYDADDQRRPPPPQPDPRYRDQAVEPGWGPVEDETRAEKLVREMLIESRNPNLKVGRVEDRGPYYEVEILTLSDALVDIMLVDKETGQMRSAYR